MDRTPDEAFRLAFRSLPGLPSGAITNMIAAKLPAKDLEGVDIDALFNAALEAQRLQFKNRLDGLFADAERTPRVGRPQGVAARPASRPSPGCCWGWPWARPARRA